MADFMPVQVYSKCNYFMPERSGFSSSSDSASSLQATPPTPCNTGYHCNTAILLPKGKIPLQRFEHSSHWSLLSVTLHVEDGVGYYIAILIIL